MVAKGKGTGMGGCCCGGCRTPPSDARSSVGTTQSIIEIQQYCCRCIPKQVCISVTYNDVTSLALVPKGCGSATYLGDPIQYTTLISIDGNSHALNFRLSVIDEQCYLMWDIPSLDLSSQTLIDQDDVVYSEACNHGMRARGCAEFGGTWTVVDPALIISISDVPSLDLQDKIECAGCKCLCDCLCISIGSRNAITGSFTIHGSNEVVCSVFSREFVSGCGNSSFYQTPWLASWSSNGWKIEVGDQYDRQLDTYTIVSGSEAVTSPCTVRDAVWIGDKKEHSITGSSIQVIYDFSIEHRKAKSVKWLGRSYDEGSTIRFDMWNWVTSEWDFLTTVDGRPVTTTINRAMFENLDPKYTGTAANEGKVRVRLTVHYGTALHTDMIRIVTGECCAFKLIPPVEIVLKEPPERIPLTGINACPSPNAFWQLTQDDDTEWFISAGCSWCGGSCGTVATACCPRPLGRNLFAEVTLGCPTCAPTTISVPLTSTGAGAIWTGSTTVCSQTLTLNFSCQGTAWHISALISNGCNWNGDASAVDCETFTVSFGGTMTGGLGCCGPSGGMGSSVSIGITVFE
jgi:hypothetical protein